MPMRHLVVALVLLLGACASSQQEAPPADTGTEAFVGAWSETWAPGEETDVDYHDLYFISVADDGTLIITCPERPNYRFPRAEAKERTLMVKLVNDYGDGDPTIIDYTLELISPDELRGRARTNKGKDVPIIWSRQRMSVFNPGVLTRIPRS